MDVQGFFTTPMNGAGLLPVGLERKGCVLTQGPCAGYDEEEEECWA